ncbi:MAG: hypothetical protein AAF959_01625 [Cyanobacteria bacterium P01_D01_bin.56]
MALIMTVDFSSLSGTDFTLGVLGAAFVEIYRFKSLCDQGKFRWIPSALVPHIIWVLTFLAGAGLLAAVQAVSPQMSSFYAGLTAPVFFAVILKDNSAAERELENLVEERDITIKSQRKLEERLGQVNAEYNAQRQELEELQAEIVGYVKSIIPNNTSLQSRCTRDDTAVSVPDKFREVYQEFTEKPVSEKIGCKQQGGITITTEGYISSYPIDAPKKAFESSERVFEQKTLGNRLYGWFRSLILGSIFLLIAIFAFGFYGVIFAPIAVLSIRYLYSWALHSKVLQRFLSGIV